MNILYVLQAFSMATAISIDAFCTAFSYGTDNIEIPNLSLATIHFLSLTVIYISVKFGSVLSGFLSPKAMTQVSFWILLLLGTSKLFDKIIKNRLQKTETGKKDIHFSLMSIKFILSVYADPKTADADCSKTLSPKEAAILAITLSADSLPIGIGIGLSAFPVWYMIPTVLLFDEIALRSGNYFGKKAKEKLRFDISWISGAILICMAMLK